MPKRVKRKPVRRKTTARGALKTKARKGLNTVKARAKRGLVVAKRKARAGLKVARQRIEKTLDAAQSSMNAAVAEFKEKMAEE